MKETPTINRRDLLLGASPTATLMILGAATTDSAIAQAATTPVAYVPTFFNAVEWSFIGDGSGFTAGEPAAAVALTLLIRTGRSSEYKHELLKCLWDLLQSATGAPDDQIVIGIQEVPPSQAMEMGEIMPDVAKH